MYLTNLLDKDKLESNFCGYNLTQCYNPPKPCLGCKNKVEYEQKEKIIKIKKDYFIIIIGFIEAIYVIYMLRYFKTKVSFSYGNSLNYLHKLSEFVGLNKEYI